MSGIPGQFDSFRRRNKEEFSSTRRGSMERGRSEKRGLFSGEDYGPSLDNFRPVTLTVSSFFKQVMGLSLVHVLFNYQPLTLHIAMYVLIALKIGF